MTKRYSFAGCCLAVLLFTASTIADSAAKAVHHGHTYRRGNDGPQSQQDAQPSVSNSAAHHGSGNGTAKPETQVSAPMPTNDHGVGTVNGSAASNQDSTGRQNKQNTQNTGGERPQTSSVETTNGSPGKGAKSPEIHMNDLGTVDTRITVQPRLHGANHPDAGGPKDKAKPHTPAFLHTQPQPVHRNAGEAIHNAIGVSIPPPPHDAAGSAQGSDSRAHTASLAATPSSHEAGTGASNTVVSPGRLTTVQPNQRAMAPNPLTAPDTINGSGFRRRGFAPAVVGGQIKTYAGISGSMIRPKH
jgi:hypothetical protein